MSFAFIQGIGVTDLLIVLGIVLLIFGPKRLPMLGRQLGSGLREFKNSITGKDEPETTDLPPTRDEPEPLEGEVVTESRR